MLARRLLISVVLGCIVVSRVAASQDAKPASLRFRLPDREGPIRVEAFDMRTGSAVADLEKRTEREVVAGFTVFAIDGGCDPSVAYVVHTPAGIAFPNATRCEETAEVDVLPARGFVLAVSAEGALDAVRVDLLECTSPASNGAVFGRIRVPLDNGRGVMRLPERCVQPQVFASGYAPKRLGNCDVANLTSSAELSATLRKGASIAVQVVAGDEQIPVPAVDAAIDDGSDALGDCAAAPLSGDRHADGLANQRCRP